MTTTTNSEIGEHAGDTTQDASWSGIVIRIANQLARPDFKRGDLADLRRMKPSEPDSPVFLRLLARHDLLEGNGLGPQWERKWALVIHGLALMTPTGADADGDPDSPRPTAHNPTVPVGLALYQGGQPGRERAFYAESRFNRLLSARGPMFHTLLARAFRMLGSDQPLNWRQMSDLIFQEGHNEGAADRIRYQIARAYYQAERRASQSSVSDRE